MDAPQLGESSEGRSSRTRIKSQRAIESETTLRLLARARKAEAGIFNIANNHNEETGQEGDAHARSPTRGKRSLGTGTGSGSKKSKSKAKAKPRRSGKKEEVYCVCKKPTSEDDGPMIECAECNDW
jgi:hypothetical protein